MNGIWNGRWRERPRRETHAWVRVRDGWRRRPDRRRREKERDGRSNSSIRCAERATGRGLDRLLFWRAVRRAGARAIRRRKDDDERAPTEGRRLKGDEGRTTTEGRRRKDDDGRVTMEGRRRRACTMGVKMTEACRKNAARVASVKTSPRFTSPVAPGPQRRGAQVERAPEAARSRRDGCAFGRGARRRGVTPPPPLAAGVREKQRRARERRGEQRTNARGRRR